MILSGGFQDQGKRKEQQDAFGILESTDKIFNAHAGKLAVVADGMGGLAQGKEASSLAIKVFTETYRKKLPEEEIATALLRSLHLCNKAVYQFSEDQGMDGKIGTTLVACVIHGDDLYWISVGDSRIYLIQNNSISLLTTDHSYESRLEELVAQEKISLEDANSHPQKASLTSYIGSEEIDLIGRNTNPLKCFDTDKVLLCSDGLYSRLKDAEIVSLTNADPKTASKNLVEKKLSMKIKNQDNLTSVILQKNGGASMSKSSENSFPAIAAVAIILIIATYMFFKPSEADLSIPLITETQDKETLVESVVEESVIKESEIENSPEILKETKPIKENFEDVPEKNSELEDISKVSNKAQPIIKKQDKETLIEPTDKKSEVKYINEDSEKAELENDLPVNEPAEVTESNLIKSQSSEKSDEDSEEKIYEPKEIIEGDLTEEDCEPIIVDGGTIYNTCPGNIIIQI